MGYPKLVLWVRCLSPGAVNADFVARICDVFPSGRSVNICDGVKRIRFADLPRDGRDAFRVEIDIYPVQAPPPHRLHWRRERERYRALSSDEATHARASHHDSLLWP